MKNGSNVIIEIWLTTDISNAYESHSLFVTLYQLSYKAVCLKICSLSYFPLFVLHCVAGLNPLAVSTKLRVIDIKTTSCFEINIAIQWFIKAEM